jgi:hypothetical protein
MRGDRGMIPVPHLQRGRPLESVCLRNTGLDPYEHQTPSDLAM